MKTKNDNTVVPQKSFQERIKDRIKDDIGKLMTDEELAAIVNRSVEDIFFGNRKVKITGSGYRSGEYQDAPPFIHELLHKLMVKELTEQVDKWLKEHKEGVLETINDVIERGMANAVIKTFEDKFSNDLTNFMTSLQSRMQ